MKKNLINLLIAMGLLLSANMAFPMESSRFDGGGPIPTCLPGTQGCPQQPGR
jgi:hypothetical protein